VHKAQRGSAPSATVQKLLAAEKEKRLDTLAPYMEFAERAAASRTEVLAFFDRVRAEGKTIAGLGASTKGNVILQYCGLTAKDMPAIGEVNSDKVGCYTPGTGIPIVSEDELLARRPDYLLVLPWHFRRFFEGNRKFSSTQLVVPLPRLELI
jgi:hypothetical protein